MPDVELQTGHVDRGGGAVAGKGLDVCPAQKMEAVRRGAGVGVEGVGAAKQPAAPRLDGGANGVGRRHDRSGAQVKHRHAAIGDGHAHELPGLRARKKGKRLPGAGVRPHPAQHVRRVARRRHQPFHRPLTVGEVGLVRRHGELARRPRARLSADPARSVAFAQVPAVPYAGGVGATRDPRPVRSHQK